MPRGQPRQPEKNRVNRSLAQRVPTQERQQNFLAAYRRLGGIVHAAESVGMSHNTHTDWLKRDKDYRVQFEAADNTRIEELETEAWSRAKEKSDLLLIFLLRAARPGKYRERHELTGANGAPITVIFGGRYKPR